MPASNLSTAFEKAAELFRGGQLPLAATAVADLLRAEPANADALHLSGQIELARGRPKIAEPLLAEAVRIRSKPRFLTTLGDCQVALGKIAPAVEMYRRALALKSDFAEATDGIGVAAAMAGQLPQAIELFRRAIAQRPDYAAAHHHLGRALEQRGLPLDDPAILSEYSIALQLEPRLTEARHALALFHGKRGRYEKAAEGFAEILREYPNHIDALHNQGVAFKKLGRLAEAVDPLRKAAELSPSPVNSLIELGSTLIDLGRAGEAVEPLEKALAAAPGDSLAHATLGLALLTLGNFDRGWDEYEHRWQVKSFPEHDRKFVQPKWEGQDIAGKSLLVHAEQGFGDQLQFIRYVPFLAERGIRVTVECPTSLAPVLRTVAGVSATVGLGQINGAFDFRIAPMSLPRIFRTRVDTIPANVPYLSVEDSRIAPWRQLMAAHDKKLKIGLVWSGRSSHNRDRDRSAAISLFAPLAKARPDAIFVSLQKRDDASPAPQPPEGLPLLDINSRLKDFADTAALIKQLDLVIGVDTAVIHLAGALAKPVWTLLAFGPDFRWMLDREDSPWYPTMRLFRQKTPGDWVGVMDRVGKSLKTFEN